MTNLELYALMKAKKGGGGSQTTEETLKSLITRQITEVAVPSDITSIGSSAFQNCRNLQTVTLSHGVERINVSAFTNCVSLTHLYLPNTINYIANTNPFNGCAELTVVSLENGFNANGLNLSASTNFTAEIIVAMLNALADRTGLEAYTLTLGNTNLAKLSEEEIAVATEKNWTLA